ncbi:MAG: hypothetical protein H7A23_18695 [Leptospiraceae bacterium]|nr:hypothetical protein [Leptospiraceae bacterium]
MKLLKPDEKLVPYGLRAMKMVAEKADTGLGSSHRTLLDAAQKVLLHTNIDIDTLEPITPIELLEHFVDEALQHQLIHGMIVLSLVDNPSTKEQTKLISEFAKAFGVAEPALDVVSHLANKEMLKFKLDFFRRSHLHDALKNQYKEHGGIIGLAKAILGVKGLVEDKELAKKFHDLGKLPEDTLGYGFYRHYVDHGFPFPGEKGGFPYSGVYHDFGHVLSGYGVTPEGETLQGCFQAGFRKSENAFFIILFVVLSFSAGINVTP